MNVTARLRQHLKSNPELAKLLMPGTKNEVLLDLNGDGKVDFAFIDQTGDGNHHSVSRALILAAHRRIR